VALLLQDELKVLFPGLRISEQQMVLSEGDMDLFLAYAVSTILYYQKEMKKLEVRCIVNCVVTLVALRWVERLKKQLSVEHTIQHNTTRWQDSVRLNECLV
jgi:hypothetical protein